MEVVHARCAGLDVHKKSVYGCVICCEADGEKRQEKRSFGTMTRGSAEFVGLAETARGHARGDGSYGGLLAARSGRFWRASST